MTKTEKILLRILTVAAICQPLMRLIEVELFMAFLLIFFITLGSILILYLVRFKRSIFSIVIVLWLIQWVGALFKILHFTGADELLWLGNIAHCIFSIALLWTIQKTSPKPDVFYYVTAFALLLQSVLLLTRIEDLRFQAELLNYLILGSIGTIKLKDLSIKPEADKLLTIYLIQSIGFVIDQVIEVMQ